VSQRVDAEAMAGHFSITKCERSELAELAANLL
jgi:predicted ribonuclease YlaK